MNRLTMSKTRREIILVSEFVEMTWCNPNTDYYIEKGYEYTKYLDKFWCCIEDLPPMSKKEVVVQCPVCEKERLAKYNNINIAGHSICNSCSGILDISGMRFGRLLVLDIDPTDLGNLPRGSKWRCLCDCGTKKIVLATSMVKGETTSCGCYHKEMMSGENNLNWNPDLTDEERNDRRRSPEYFQWIRNVFERDGFTCQVCNDDSGGNLEAHHLYSHSKYRKYRMIINNGITLCKTCHKKFHNWMGHNRIPCTPEDFQNWLCEIDCYIKIPTIEQKYSPPCLGGSWRALEEVITLCLLFYIILRY